MIFKDISFFDNFDLNWLKGLIVEPLRKREKITFFKSAMMVNPLKVEHINKIDEVDADIIVINLEDGIAKEQKERAMVMAGVFISNLQSPHVKVVVRVNPFDEGGKEEIAFLNAVKPDAIRVAKVREMEDIENILEVLDEDIKLHLSIETKEAFNNLRYINMSGKVEACYLGALDLLTDLELPQSTMQFHNPTAEYIMSRFLVDCRIAGVVPVGFTYQNYNDLEGFRNWCKLEKSMGYRSKSCLGPKQVKIANTVFKEEEWIIEKARHIKEAFEAKAKDGITGFMDDDYGFIDEPVYKDALLTLEKIK
jgi:citrate lyase subunit beta/citryl-CoA lyase